MEKIIWWAMNAIAIWLQGLLIVLSFHFNLSLNFLIPQMLLFFVRVLFLMPNGSAGNFHWILCIKRRLLGFCQPFEHNRTLCYPISHNHRQQTKVNSNARLKTLVVFCFSCIGLFLCWPVCISQVQKESVFAKPTTQQTQRTTHQVLVWKLFRPCHTERGSRFGSQHRIQIWEIAKNPRSAVFNP